MYWTNRLWNRASTSWITTQTKLPFCSQNDNKCRKKRQKCTNRKWRREVLHHTFDIWPRADGMVWGSAFIKIIDKEFVDWQHRTFLPQIHGSKRVNISLSYFGRAHSVSMGTNYNLDQKIQETNRNPNMCTVQGNGKYCFRQRDGKSIENYQSQVRNLVYLWGADVATGA